jgi:Tol biopolymer transport system component
VPFEVTCRGGAVRIAVTTNGSDVDWDGYVANVLSGTTSLAVDGLAVNGAAALGDFAAGRALTAQVDGRERNCSVSPETVAVTVPDNDTTTASFTVTCSTLPVGGILFSDDGGLLSRFIPSLDGIVTIGEGSEAAWAPGGAAITFVAGSAVHVAGPVGADVRSLVAGGSPAWTPDGSRVAFLKPARCQAGCTWPGTIDVADPATQSISLVPMASDDDRKGIRRFDVAPSGSEVAYILAGDNTTPDALVVSNLDGSNRRILLERNYCQPGTGCKGGILSVRYSPSGQELLANVACYLGVESEACGVMVIPVGGAAPRVLAPLSSRGWDWSPDGTQVLISETANGESTLLTVSAMDGSGAATVYEHDFVVTSASWAR